MNIPFIQQQFFDNQGRPLSNGKLYAFTAGSTTIPKPLYLDSGLTILAPTPLVLNASGQPQKYYMELGGYNMVLKDSSGNLVDSWDYQYGTSNGVSGTIDYKVKTSLSDTNPDYLSSKIVPGDGMDVNEIVGSTRQIEITSQGRVKVNMSDSAGYLDSKFQSSPSITFSTNGHILSATVNSNGVSGLYKVKTTSFDNSPGYLVDKVIPTPSIDVSSSNGFLELSVNPSVLSGDHKVAASSSDNSPGYLVDKITTDDTLISYATSANNVEIGSLGKVACYAPVGQGDIQGYLQDKIKAGSGISITSTDDLTYGKVLWINSKTNLWTPVKYINGSAYTVLDTDGTLSMTNDARTAVMFITFPTASVNYLGRTIVIRGSSQWAGGIVLGTVVGSASCGSNGVLANGFKKNSFTCLYNNDTTSYAWFNDLY